MKQKTFSIIVTDKYIREMLDHASEVKYIVEMDNCGEDDVREYIVSDPENNQIVSRAILIQPNKWSVSLNQLYWGQD